MHTRDSYSVDAYMLFTGHAVPVTLREEGEEEKKFMKIEAPETIVICGDCYKKPEIREAAEKFEAPGEKG